MASGRGGQGGNAQQGRNDSDTDANRAEQDPSQRNAQRGLRDLAAPRQRGVRDGGRETANGTSGGGVDSYDGPLTGENFVEWSDRLRNVEEMLDSPELRREVARVREAAKGMRAEFKRHGEEPKWELVRTQIGEPLAELRNRITEELARRETKDSLVPIDRDPVPTKYADRVRRYYEDLGRSR
jgi:hypothetical protein